nr:hypothetical protein [Tanacetum cinerariifolium]
MFDVNVLDGEEVFVKEHEVVVKRVNDKVNVVEKVVELINTAKLIIDVAQDSVAGDIVSTGKINVDHQLAERMEVQEQEELSIAEKNMGGYKLKDLKLKEFDSIQEMSDIAFKRVNTFEDFRTELVKGKEKRAGTELIQEITKKQKVEDDKETTKLKQFIEIIPDE